MSPVFAGIKVAAWKKAFLVPFLLFVSMPAFPRKISRQEALGTINYSSLDPHSISVFWTGPNFKQHFLKPAC
jgi:hypothetical protein